MLYIVVQTINTQIFAPTFEICTNSNAICIIPSKFSQTTKKKQKRRFYESDLKINKVDLKLSLSSATLSVKDSYLKLAASENYEQSLTEKINKYIEGHFYEINGENIFISTKEQKTKHAKDV